MLKNVSVKICIGENSTKDVLTLRYILADTIEDRKIAKVLSEGCGEDYVDLGLSTELTTSEIKDQLMSLMVSLGIEKFEIFIEEE